MKRAIVLSGGGAKGAYEIGVWKALRKLHIKYDIITGTSVGALNGALMVQNSYFKACYLWNRMDFNRIFNENDLKEFSLKKDNLSLMKMYAKNILNGGIDVTDLETLVKECLKPKKIKKSKINFGIITVNTKTLKPKIIKKDEIDINKLCDYLIASASCYPVFKQKTIDEDHFMDGGFYDNMPINLAIEMGADDIIAVNLDAIGMSRSIKDKNVPITYIKPRNKIGSFLVFEKIQARKAIQFGYNDTLKTFNKLEGNKFTFYRKELTKNYQKHETNMKQNLKNIFNFSGDKSLLEQLMTIVSYKRLSNSKDIDKALNRALEHLATACKIDESKIYRVNDLHKQIIDIMTNTTAVSLNNIKKVKLPGTKEAIKYFYETIKTSMNNDKQKKELCTLSIGFPKEFLSALYLYTIEQEK